MIYAKFHYTIAIHMALVFHLSSIACDGKTAAWQLFHGWQAILQSSVQVLIIDKILSVIEMKPLEALYWYYHHIITSLDKIGQFLFQNLRIKKGHTSFGVQVIEEDIRF